ncbi:hypothetical protein [Corynebacterium sp.]|uniref:hypothetical protein n=1 Tax=Corynebacterium sp. TaxID=1720 RepID=UPI0025C3AA29|nr:hypothetical protein [Corynebacterium sp.]
MSDVNDEGLREARRWAGTVVLAPENKGVHAAARYILDTIPAPPKSLAEQMLDIAGGISSDFGAYADDLNALADRVEAVEKERDDLQDIVDASAADLQQRDDEIERLNAEVERLQEQEEARKDELHKYREIRKHQRDELARLNAEVEAIRNALLYDGGSLPPGMTVAEGVEHLARTFDRLNPDLLTADRAPVTASSAALPDPADVPEGEPWLVEAGIDPGVGFRSPGRHPWAVAFKESRDVAVVKDTDITLISRLVPEVVTDGDATD